MKYVDSERVIMEVGKYPCLYNRYCEDSKNASLREQAWVNIYKSIVGDSWEEMSCEKRLHVGNEIKKKWRCVKDAFTRSLRNQEMCSVNGYGCKKPYIYQKHLKFLIDCSPYKNKSFLKKSSIKKSQDSDTDNEDEEERYDETGATSDARSEPTPERESISESPVKPVPQSPPSEPKSISKEQAEQKSYEPSSKRQKKCSRSATFENSPETSYPTRTPSLHEHNSDKMFLLSLLPRVVELNPAEKLNFQIKVMQLLKHYTTASARRSNSRNLRDSSIFTSQNEPRCFRTSSTSVNVACPSEGGMSPLISVLDSEESISSGDM